MSDKHQFVPRTHCPNGHDLSVTGYRQTGWQSSLRCRECDDKQRRKQAKTAANKRWRKDENHACKIH